MKTKKLYIKPLIKVLDIDKDILLVYQSAPIDPGEDDWDLDGNKNAKAPSSISNSPMTNSSSSLSGRTFVSESPFD